MKYTNKQYLINIFIALCFIIMVILISMYLLHKTKNNNDTFQNTATNDNYFSVDTINKITSSNLSIPTIEQNTLMLPVNTILPYYNDFNNTNVIDLINNNYLPCNNNVINQDIIKNCNKSIYYNYYTAISANNNSAFYTITVIYPNQVIESINIPDLRRLYMAGAGDKINSVVNNRVHPSFNSSNVEYTKGKIIGEELHKLTLNELARHKHVPYIRVDGSSNNIYYRNTNPGTILTGGLYYGLSAPGNDGYALLSSKNRDEYVNPFGIRSISDRTIHADISVEGKDLPHENRPPTVIVNYIMYVGELPNKASTASN